MTEQLNKQLNQLSDLSIKPYTNGNANKVAQSDGAFHNWYRFVLSFPPHLVREYLSKFGLKPGACVLDPFCGTGTTVIEAKLSGYRGVGIEANHMAHFATKIKTDFNIKPDFLLKDSAHIANLASKKIIKAGTNLRKLPDEASALLLKDSISPVPLHKTLVLLESILEYKSDHSNHQLLALAASTVKTASNIYFGPEVGVLKNKKTDADVVKDWLEQITLMANDVRTINGKKYLPAVTYNGDARLLSQYLKPQSIDAVFTSPPYPNEKDYTRTTRLESVLLGFFKNKDDLKALKKNLLRSNTRNVYKGDDDDQYISDHKEIIDIAKEIEKRRIEMNKTSGFEKAYHKVARLYFGGMAKHLESLRPFLKKNAMLGYVVGDQASYLRVYIPTGRFIADIAEKLGYELISIDLFRTRFATVTKRNMNEEVVVLKWKG